MKSPAARALLEKIGPGDGKLTMLDALHTNQATVRQIVQKNASDYLLPVKENHEGLLQRAQQVLPTACEKQTPAPPAGLSPLWSPPSKAIRTTAAQVRYRRERGKKPLALREAQPARCGQQP